LFFNLRQENILFCVNFCSVWFDVVPNDNGTFLDLVFTNAPVDVSVPCADSPLLKLDRHHRAYEIEMRVCCCKFEAMESRTQRYMFRIADCAAIDRKST
jgi:hypothetical protein